MKHSVRLFLDAIKEYVKSVANIVSGIVGRQIISALGARVEEPRLKMVKCFARLAILKKVIT